MDIIVVIILMGLAVFLFTNRRNFFYFFGSVDIFLRILNFIALNIGVPEITNLIKTYLPASLASVITHYSSGAIETILLWLYVFCYIAFEVYIVKLLLKRK